MKYFELGKSGIKVSQLVQGLWEAGGGYFGDPADKDTIDAVHADMEIGLNTFDTAEIYGMGHSEDVLGEALKTLKGDYKRDDYVLIAKAWTTHYAKSEMEKALDVSLKRMNTDYLDVYFLHYPPYWGNENPVTIEEAVNNINDMKKKGKICGIGLSNFSLDELKEAQKYAQIDVIQPGYNLLWRYIDRDIFPYCRENDIAVITYSSLAQGLLTGTLKKDSVVTDGRSKSVLFQPGTYEKCLEVTDFLIPIAAKYSVSVPQLVISWMVNTPGITAPIVGNSNREQVFQNAEALKIDLSKEDYDAIDERSKQFIASVPEFELNFNLNSNALSEAKKSTMGDESKD